MPSCIVHMTTTEVQATSWMPFLGAIRAPHQWMKTYRVQEQIRQPGGEQSKFVEWELQANPDLDRDDSPKRVLEGRKPQPVEKSRLVPHGKDGIDFLYQS